MIRIMEVCGTHTMEIARAGIRGLLPEGVRLVSGPGCPVCVTSPGTIDAVLELASLKGITIATYGDMMRVPGSTRGDTLLARRTKGADVRMVYSALDAVEIAKKEPAREVVFLGVGFETSAPGTAYAVEAAAKENVQNFSVFSMLKLLEPSVRALAADPAFHINAFLAPGHVAVILGEDGLRFFEKLGFPAVISGFEPEEIARAITMLLKQIKAGEARLENAYPSVVTKTGNTKAREVIDRYLAPRTDNWRGLGRIADSGLGIRDAYAAYDAEKKYGIRITEPALKSACRCGEVIQGKLEPVQCPLFGKGCDPENPEGPCMVSAEGACAAAYRYRGMNNG
ncbi:MAG: hydrogenase formation protein HypD [Lachnospiraceae bacterium]|nr:hydrogenase formation protein HypD [Lachnospiraceae bacterium]